MAAQADAERRRLVAQRPQPRQQPGVGTLVRLHPGCACKRSKPLDRYFKDFPNRESSSEPRGLDGAHR